MDQNYKITLRQISTFIFDVDGVLTNGQLLVSTDGELLREMNVRDGFALKQAILAGYNVCIISGGKNEGVRKRLQGLGVIEIYLGIENKIESLQEFFENYKINPEEVVYMGDDIPDIPPMKMVGLSACPQDAVPEVKQASTYISHLNGGEGCVRDLIEQVMKLQGKWNF